MFFLQLIMIMLMIMININTNNVISTNKDTQSYAPIVTLSARDNQKLSKLLSKGFERTVYWNELKNKT